MKLLLQSYLFPDHSQGENSIGILIIILVIFLTLLLKPNITRYYIQIVLLQFCVFIVVYSDTYET